MRVDQLETWFNKHKADTNYQHKDMPLDIMAHNAYESFERLTDPIKKKIIAVCKAYGVITRPHALVSVHGPNEFIRAMPFAGKVQGYDG